MAGERKKEEEERGKVREAGTKYNHSCWSLFRLSAKTSNSESGSSSGLKDRVPARLSQRP